MGNVPKKKKSKYPLTKGTEPWMYGQNLGTMEDE